MKWIFDDGGRSNYYKKLNVGDCVCRAISIASESDYKVIYKLLKEYGGGESPRNGVYKEVYTALLKDMGWTWVPCSGKGIKNSNVHLRSDELPRGRIICRVSKHLTCVVDGELHDTYDCTRGGNRKVYGYWIKK